MAMKGIQRSRTGATAGGPGIHLLSEESSPANREDDECRGQDLQGLAQQADMGEPERHEAGEGLRPPR